MHIPRTWARADAEVESPEHGTVPLVAWGWGDDAGPLAFLGRLVGRKSAEASALETVGKGGFVGGDHHDLVEIHDRATRATESLPLA